MVPRFLALKQICLGAFLISSLSAFGAAAWRPPANPDPEAILSEAEEDTRAGRYEDALAKHVWFHEHALEHAPGMYGVRLSFALSSWGTLGRAYPPALEVLEAIRDKAGETVRTEGDLNSAFHSFHDFAAINRELGEDMRTTELFLWLDANKPDIATRAFDVAQPALIRAKQYQLCGKYIDPDRSFEQIVHIYRVNKNLARDPEFDKDLREFSEKDFANHTATLVALLVINGRKGDADRISGRAQIESSDPVFRNLLQKARQGEVPEPWP